MASASQVSPAAPPLPENPCTDSGGFGNVLSIQTVYGFSRGTPLYAACFHTFLDKGAMAAGTGKLYCLLVAPECPPYLGACKAQFSARGVQIVYILARVGL